MIVSRVKFFVLVLALGAVAGCADTVETIDLPSQTTYSVRKYRKEYVISAGDKLEVDAQRIPEVSRTVVVRSDGMITLPMAGDIPAAGKSFPELKDEITARLGSRFHDPEIDVIAVDVAPALVYVVGEVTAPQAVQLRQAHTAAQAVAQAGGFVTAARRGAVLIRLQEDGRLAAIPLMPKKWGQSEGYVTLETALLQSDDIVFVPESARSQFTRFIDDFINKPLSGVNSILGTYVNYKLTEQLDASIKELNRVNTQNP